MINTYVSGFVPIDYHTENLDVVIDEEIPGRKGKKKLALIGLEYLAAGTAHVLSILHTNGDPGQRTACAVGAASGQKLIICDAVPTDGAGADTAGSDIMAYEVAGGGWEFNVVTSLATATITTTTNLAKAIPAGGRVVIFGVVGDLVCYQIGLAASVTTRLYDGIYAVAPHFEDPLYVTIDNATAAGFLKNMLWAYINK